MLQCTPRCRADYLDACLSQAPAISMKTTAGQHAVGEHVQRAPGQGEQEVEGLPVASKATRNQGIQESPSKGSPDVKHLLPELPFHDEE